MSYGGVTIFNRRGVNKFLSIKDNRDTMISHLRMGYSRCTVKEAGKIDDTISIMEMEGIDYLSRVAEITESIWIIFRDIDVAGARCPTVSLSYSVLGDEGKLFRTPIHIHRMNAMLRSASHYNDFLIWSAITWQA